MTCVVFGAGFYGRYTYYLLKKQGVSIASFVVSEIKDNPDHVFDIPVRPLDSYIEDKQNIKIYIGVDRNKYDEVYTYIKNEGFINIDKIAYPLLGYVSFSDMPKKEFLSMWYSIYKGKDIPWDNPRSFNEKIQYVKLYGITDLMRELTDKNRVREWVKDRIGEEFLVPIYGVWNKFEDIDFSVMPERYVLKCNHGCGYNYIVRNSNEINFDNVEMKFRQWLSEDYGYIGGLEMQYHNISPCIIAEKYLENKNDDLYDYKFWCFKGKVEFIMYLCGRENELKMNNYDTDWNLLPFTYNYSNTDYNVPCPTNLDKMIFIAEKMAKGFEFVRVDLYHLNDGSIKFGEMTFTPASGLCKWSDEKVNDYLGSLFEVT